MIAPAVELSHGRYTVEDVYDDVCQGVVDLWIAIDYGGRIIGAVVTSVSRWPRRQALSIDFVGIADGHQWKDDLPALFSLLEASARSYDCDEIMITGRKGWARVLSNAGFDERFTVVVKEVRNG